MQKKTYIGRTKEFPAYLYYCLYYVFLLSMICAITIQITLKYVALEVTRPEKDCFSVREQGFKPFPYPVPIT